VLEDEKIYEVKEVKITKDIFTDDGILELLVEG